MTKFHSLPTWQIDTIHNNIGDEYVLGRYLAEGQHGKVYELCGETCDLIVKIQHIRPVDVDFVNHEFNLQNRFYDAGLAPKVYTQFFEYKDGQLVAFTVMERVDDILGNYLHNKRSVEVLDRILLFILRYFLVVCRTSLVHGDLHWDNIGLMLDVDTDEYKIVMIDFGFSKETICRPYLGLVQLLRTLGPAYDKDIDEFNRTYLQKYLREFISVLYPSLIKYIGTPEDIDILYAYLLDRYQYD
jgi:tRNA A-37 threonylcarbamoyl transferase component Bud32